MRLIKKLLVAFILLSTADLIFGCTIFTASSGDSIFAGNNEDMCTTNTLIHIIPGNGNSYGRILWGFIGDENYQGGMNEFGLFFDGAGIQEVLMSECNLPEFEGTYIMETILEKCKTVKEAIDFFGRYSHPYLKYAHILVADAYGDAAIFEWGNGKLNIIMKGDKTYLIATNFNISESEDAENMCMRYKIAESIISKEAPSLHTFEKTLSLTHQEGNFCTVYSNICDLKNKKVYLYNFHNFSINREFDLEEEFSKGEKKLRIRDLFPPNFAERNFRMRYDCISDFDGVKNVNVKFQIQSNRPIPKCNLSLRGSAVELGRWNKDGVQLKRMSEHYYEKDLELKEGSLLEFQLSVENDCYFPIDHEARRIREMIYEIKSDTTLTIFVTDWIKPK